MPDKDLASGLSHLLLPQVQQLIDAARGRAASAVNAELTLLYWQIGKLLKEYVVQTERAPYGQEVMKGLAAKLTEKYGKGWSHQQLRHCLRAAETFSEDQIVSTLRRQLSWSHLKLLIYLDDLGCLARMAL